MLMADAPLTMVALDGATGNTLWNTPLTQFPLSVLVEGSNTPVLLVATQDNIVLVLANQSFYSMFAMPVVVVLNGKTGEVIPEVREHM